MKKRPKTFKTDVIIILVLVLTAAAVVYAVSGKRSAPAVTCTAAAEVTAADYNAKDKKIGILSGRITNRPPLIISPKANISTTRTMPI